MISLVELGQELRELREGFEYSQEFVANELGISRQAIISIEAGKRKIDSFELIKFSQLYGVEPRDLLSQEKKLAVVGFDAEVMHLRNSNEVSEETKKVLMNFKQICEDYKWLKRSKNDNL